MSVKTSIILTFIALILIEPNNCIIHRKFVKNFNFPDDQQQPQPDTNTGNGGGYDMSNGYNGDGGGGGGGASSMSFSDTNDPYAGNPLPPAVNTDNDFDPNTPLPQMDLSNIDNIDPSVDFNSLIRQGVTLPPPPGSGGIQTFPPSGGIIVPTVVPTSIPLAPLTTAPPPPPPIAPIIPGVPAPPTGQTCICVPAGSCNTTVGSIDGTGLIDIRIVTNANGIPASTIVSPGISCQTGLVSCCQPGPYQCGKQYPPVAGSPIPGPGQASFGEYPWQAVLLGPNQVYVGSGVLIDSLNVLTVAHRITTYTSAPNTLTVRMGEWNSGSTTEPIIPTNFPVSKIFVNPNFSNTNLKNDIAILRLANPVQLGLTSTITTGCLPNTTYTGQRCWVSGWGTNDFNSTILQPVQKETDVPILPTQTCQSELSATRLGSIFQFDASSFICAGGENGKDACTGDGGSPLVCNVANTWYVAGLVSWGIGCAQTNVPGVYVNVLNYIPWIQTTINTP